MCRHDPFALACPACEAEARGLRESSIPLPDGGDTHIHPFGRKEKDFTVTTRIPIGNGLGSIGIHNGPDDDDFNWKP